MELGTFRRTRLLQTLLHGCLVTLVIAASVPAVDANNLADCINHNVTFDGIVPLRYATVKSTPGPRLYLHESYPEHCALGSEASCSARAYLVPGNAVAIGKNCGEWAYVQYIGEKLISEGWVESEALTPIPPPAPLIKNVYTGMPKRYPFKLTRGRGTSVCEADLQRLNQMEFRDPPYCGRPESTPVPGFTLLHRRYLNLAEYVRLWSDVTGEPKSAAPVYRGFTPAAWAYVPPLNIENSVSSDTLVMWTDTDRYSSQCGAADTRTGVPMRVGALGLLVSTDGRINNEKTYKIFGERNGAKYGRPAAAEFAHEFDIFRYRNKNYFDTFLDQGYDFTGGPPYAWSNSISDTLAVFLVDHGTRRETCEYYVSDLRTSP